MKKGYTLIEMTVVMALLSLIGVAMVAMFLTTARSGGKSGALAIVKQEGDYAITTMERYIHFAKDIISPSPCANTITTNLEISRFDGEPNLIFKQVTNGTINQIARDISGTTDYLTSTKVNATSFSFTCNEVNKIKTVDINFNLANTGEAINEPFHTKVVLRNKAQ